MGLALRRATDVVRGIGHWAPPGAPWRLGVIQREVSGERASLRPSEEALSGRLGLFPRP